MSWQKILAQGFSSAQELLQFLELPALLGSSQAEQQFATRVPRGFAKRMTPGNPNDPLLLQVLASANELTHQENYHLDPLGEQQANPLKGLLHKYHGRVLIILAGACAINCRFCFRRHFPYETNNPGREGLKQIFNYIANDLSIEEVILSGGEPLLISDIALSQLITHLEAIPHVKTMRFHSRIPIVLPERINQSLLKRLTESRLKKVMVFHCNHPQEINEEVAQVCQQLKEAGCVLLNQTVLLKGINNCADILAQLSKRLFDNGVLPYYLHVLDKVAGISHFDLLPAEINIIYQQLQRQLSGYLLPKLVREEAGKKSKTLYHT